MLKRYINTFSIFTLAHWQRHSEYRVSAILWILNGFIVPLILMSVWLLVRGQQELPLNNAQIITYFLLTTVIVRLTQSWIGEHLGEKIKDGLLSKHLIMPLPYWLPEISKDFALKLVRLISLIPFIGIFYALFTAELSETLMLDNFAVFALSLIIGYSINFVLQNIVGLMAFWVEHTSGIHSMFATIVGLFSGMVIPFTLMPSKLQSFSNALPFRYIINVPVRLLMERQESVQIIKDLLFGIVWIGMLSLLWILLYRKGIKNYTSVGI